MLLFGQHASASGIFESFVIIDLNGGGNTYYDIDSTTANADFGGANFGVPASLTLNGGQIKTFEDPDSVDNAVAAQVFYRVYKVGDAPGSFAPIALDQLGPQVGNDRTWEEAAAGINILSGLTPGVYNFEVFGRAQFNFDDGQGSTGSFESFANNGGANRIATFEVIPEPTTMLLVGMGLAGTMMLRRRKA